MAVRKFLLLEGLIRDKSEEEVAMRNSLDDVSEEVKQVSAVIVLHESTSSFNLQLVRLTKSLRSKEVPINLGERKTFVLAGTSN